MATAATMMMPAALDGLGHIVGGHGDLHRALALIAEVAELGAGEGDAGLLNVGKVDLGEAGLVPQADLLALRAQSAAMVLPTAPAPRIAMGISFK